MNLRHRNKTLATFLSSVFGSIGLHRFYLYGKKDLWAWVHLLSLPLSGIAVALLPNQPALLTFSPLLVSGLSGFIEALVIGLTPDDKWDVQHNPESGRQSQSSWVLAVILVLTLAVGALGLIAAIARFFDLYFTGGAYG